MIFPLKGKYNFKIIIMILIYYLGLMRYQELREFLEDEEVPFNIKVRRLRDISKAHDDLRLIDQSETKFDTRYILLDLEADESYEILLKQVIIALS